MTRAAQIHGTAVAIAFDCDGPLAGALILGRSGSGKSALALSLIEACPWRRTALVADDVVIVAPHGDALLASAPEKLAGFIEIRGFGLARVRAAAGVRLDAAFDLDLASERAPEPLMRAFGACSLPVWPLAPGGDSAIRLRAILRSVLGRQTW